MSSEIEERNKTLVRRFLEAQGDKGDLDVLEELLAPDFVDHSLRPDQDSGREGYIQLVAEEQAAHSEIRYIIEEQLAEGQKVMTRCTIKRLHDQGKFLGMGPTGMELTTSGIVIHRIVGARSSRSEVRARVFLR